MQTTNPTVKSMLLTFAVLAGPQIATATPSTQPATRPAAISQANTPLIIPDGTSPQNPGPAFVSMNPDLDYFGRQYDAPNTLIPIGVGPVFAPVAQPAKP